MQAKNSDTPHLLKGTLFSVLYVRPLLKRYLPMEDPKKTTKTRKGFRLSSETLAKLDELSEMLSIDATAVVERSVDFFYEPGKQLGRQRIEDLAKKYAEPTPDK